MARYDIVVFDLDGTLIDSDEALVQPFLTLGMRREDISFGHPVEEFCAEQGIDIARYVELYDTDVVVPYDGAEELVASLDRWAVCSNKHPVSGTAELARLGWTPEVAMFADAFGGAAKRLGPVLDAVGVAADRALFVGDTAHDERCAVDVGCDFAWAAWNPRTSAARPAGTVLTDPRQVLELLA
ncbi:MAG: HAD hydrolase-like protein [Acidimicrobiales bacterium]